MISKTFFKHSLFFFAAALVLQPLLVVGQWKFDRVHAQTTNYVSPEDLYIDNSPIDSLQELSMIFQKRPPLKLSPQDANAVRDGVVDTRVVNYLIYLVTPTEQGGAGLDYLKTQRISKNYDTDGTGKFDRETLAAIEEDTGIVSAHNTGQAIDISEVGAVTCKIIKKSYLGGSSTSFQRPRPIKVAWQTRDGVNRHPTPKGPSLFEVAGNMSAQSILLMLNESGEMDEFTDYVRGLSMSEIFQYVGANILLKNYGVGDIMVDPRSGSTPDVLGALLLQQAIPNLPVGLPIAEGTQDIREAIARAHTEDLLNLPPGSLRGSGWDIVLASTGKRTLENALGLPTLTLENNSLNEVQKNESVKSSLKQFNHSDEAFGVMPGTIDLINAKDERAYVWAGVNLIADALRLSTAQREKLTTAVKNAQQPNIELGTTGTDRAVPVDVLKNIFVPNDGNEVLKDFGHKYLAQVLSSVVPNNFLGLSSQTINQLSISTSTVIYGDLRRTIGLNKIASDSSVRSGGAQDSGNYPLIAGALNLTYDLTGNSSIDSDDIDGLINGSGDGVIAKLGGDQVDKAIGWNNGTGLLIIREQKTLEQGLQEVFGNALGDILGLRSGTSISLDGDMYREYGDTIVEQRIDLNIQGNGSALDIDPQALYRAFSIRSNANLIDLRKNTSFWNSPSVIDALEYTDIRLGATIGTSKSYLLGNLSNDQISRHIAKSNIGLITKDKLLNYLELDDAFKLSNEELGSIITNIGDWDNTSFENKQKTVNLGIKLIGRTLDQGSAFSKDSILNIAQGKTSDVIVNIMIDQGIRQFAGTFGANISGFDAGDLANFAKFLTNTYNQDASTFQQQTERRRLSNWIAQATKIPSEHQSDIDAFLNGNIRTGLESWSAALMVDFARKYLPTETTLSYEEMRTAIDLNGSPLITTRANAIAAKEGGSADSYIEQARKELMQEARDSSKYKISDAFLIQAEIPIPPNFSKVMFSGSTQERSEMLTNSIFIYLDRELQRVRPSYVPGTLLGIFNGEIDPLETNELIKNIVGNNSISLGSFTSGFVSNFYQFISADDKTSFYSENRYDSMWRYMENWFGNTLGVTGLEAGYGKSLYYASQNGWDFKAGLTQNGQVIVPSMESLGTDLIANRITHWADNNLNIPAGSTYQMYQAVNSVVSASRAVAAARAGSSASQLSQAQNNLSQAQSQLTVIAINIVLNSCEACQQFFASVDKILAAPRGFTNALVAGAIASAFGLGPAGLIAAAAIYLFGVYKVEFKCPIPPPDWFSLTQFDNPEDQIDPFTSDYYQNKDQLIKDHPAVGESPFAWDNGVPFRDGNNPELWMAWSRYFTGKLLDSTMTYGASQPGVSKPLQIITYRQANVEFFGTRSSETFGPTEEGNDRLGLGFTQNSTKTTDWVHTSFGGFF